MYLLVKGNRTLSSILNALKKLEGGYSPQKDTRLWIKGPGPKNSIADRLEEFWMSIRYPFLMLGIILFIVFLWVFLSFQPIESERLSPSIFSFFQGDRNMESVPRDKEKTQHTEQTDRIKRHALPINQIPAAYRKTVTTDRNPPKIPDTESINNSKSTMVQSLQPVQDPSAHKRREENIAGHTGIFSSENKASPFEQEIHEDQNKFSTEEVLKSKEVIPLSESEIEVMNDSRLKLQAISWSKHPERRIAVINSRIVHQGDLVEGFSVLQINEDNVTVASGDNMWKLIFTVK